MKRRAMALVACCACACGGRYVGVEDDPFVEDASPETADTGSAIDGAACSSFGDLMVYPTNPVVVLDVAAPKASTVTFSARLPCDDGTIQDVTASSIFSIEGPIAIGSLVGNTFVSAVALPVSAIPFGTTSMVRASHGTSRAGLALLSLVAHDSRNDLLFVTPYMEKPTPQKQVLRAKNASRIVDVRLSLTSRLDPEAIDAAKLVASVRPMTEGDPARGCPKRTAYDSDGDGAVDTFVAIEAGGLVCFEIASASNTLAKPSGTVRLLVATADLVEVKSLSSLDRHPIVFAVPPVAITF